MEFYFGDFPVIQVGSRVIDLRHLRMRKALSQDYLEKALECALKVVKVPFFNGNSLQRELFSRAAEICYDTILKRSKFFVYNPPHIRFDRPLGEHARIKRRKGNFYAEIFIPYSQKPRLAKASTYHETIHAFLKIYQHLADDRFYEKVDNQAVRDAKEDFKLLMRGRVRDEEDLVRKGLFKKITRYGRYLIYHHCYGFPWSHLNPNSELNRRETKRGYQKWLELYYEFWIDEHIAHRLTDHYLKAS